MNAYRVEATLTQDGVVRLEGLPFRSGEAVEIIVLEKSSSHTATKQLSSINPLKGTVVEYKNPFEPAISATEWDALQ